MAFTNCATSVFAAVIIFAIMGFKVRNFAVMEMNLFKPFNPCRHTMPTKLASEDPSWAWKETPALCVTFRY